MKKQTFTGESFTYSNKDYTLNYIKPCTMEKGKKMAKVRLKNVPDNLLAALEKSGIFSEAKLFPELGTCKAILGKKHIIIFSSGEISIRAADGKEDVIKTVNLIINVIKKK